MSTTTATALGYDVERIRADFPALQQSVHGRPLVYLDNAASTHKPAAVLEALHTFYSRDYANVHRGVHTLSQRATTAFEAARTAVRDFINAAYSEEIIFTRGTTESINLVAHGFAVGELKPGDEIVVTEMEHHSNIVPWQLAAERSGAILRVIPVRDDGSLDADAWAKVLGPRTKLVAVVHVSNALGTVNPIKDIVTAAHAVGAAVLVDGAQAVLHLPVDVRDLDVDFYAFSGHKLYGPTGIGVLYGKREWLDRLPPYQGGGDMIERVSFTGTTYAPPPAKFEAGTPHIAGAVGLHAAINYVQQLDRAAIAAYEAELLAYGTTLLEAIPGVRLIGTAPTKAAVLSFVVDGIHPHDVGTLLDQQGVAVRTGHHCTQPLMQRFGVPATSRASLALYNTRAELDQLAAALQKTIALFA